MAAQSPALTNPHARPHERDPAEHVYVDRYPTLLDLLQFGGVPGVWYALISLQRIAHYQSLGWDLVARLPVITVSITDGPHAGQHGAMLMCTGRSIATMSPEGSVRPYGADPMLDELTGLGPAKPAASKPQPKA